MSTAKTWTDRGLPVQPSDQQLLDWLDAAYERETDEHDSESLFNVRRRLVALLQNEHLGGL
jgi:hypothetical protein